MSKKERSLTKTKTKKIKRRKIVYAYLILKTKPRISPMNCSYLCLNLN